MDHAVHEKFSEYINEEFKALPSPCQTILGVDLWEAHLKEFKALRQQLFDEPSADLAIAHAISAITSVPNLSIRELVTRLSALHSVASFVTDWGRAKQHCVDAERYCIPFMTIMYLFNAHIDGQGHIPQRFEDSAVVQLRVGEGRSYVLALVAAVLAVRGYSADIAGYSHYLVEHDKKDNALFFSTIMSQPGAGAVRYVTYEMLRKGPGHVTDDDDRQVLRTCCLITGWKCSRRFR